MGKKLKEKHPKLRWFSIILGMITIVVASLLTYEIFIADILPLKYFILVVFFVVLLIFLFFTFICSKRSKAWIKVLLDILFILVIAVCGFAYLKLKDTMKFLNKIEVADYETNIYYFLVNKDSNYNKLDDIKNKEFSVVNENEDINNFEKTINNKVEIDIKYEESASDLIYKLMDDQELIIIVNSAYYESLTQMEEIDQKDIDKIKILDKFEIRRRLENESTGIDVVEDAFVVYLSGIDTRNNDMPAKSLSDVNILLVINPKTKDLLMIHTPRDYYVQLHGTTGYKDKLTHAGLKGLETSKSTIEDIYSIDIPYYVRVNFKAVEKLIDAIGGITLYNDQNKTITCWTNQSCKFKPGDNDVKGECALAFARERHAYKYGDRHRGENQEQVIQKVIEKVTSSKTLITKYSDILESLEGTFQTNITTDEITDLVKMQIDDMAKWNISTYNVSGTDSYEFTASYPSKELYVMVPKKDTIEEAKVKIQEILDKK